MINYQGLFDIMKEKNIKQIELREKGIHPRTFSKMANGDIMRYVPDPPVVNEDQ